MLPLMSPQPVKYRGTVTGLRISAVDGGGTESGGAFVDGANASITALADGAHLIEIYDSANRMIKGVLKAAGSAEGLDVELIGDPAFDSDAYWLKTEVNWTVLGGKAIAVAVDNGHAVYKQISNTVGALYKSVVICDAYTEGTFGIQVCGITVPFTGTGTKTAYRTSAGDTSFGINSTTDFPKLTASFTDITAKQVLTPSTSGATIVSAKGGTVWNFSYKNTSFEYNEASYYVIVKKLR
jgi:hypothetical protein